MTPDREIAMDSRGRPSSYNEEVVTKILEKLAAGESLLSICRAPDMPAESTVRKWAAEDREGFYAKYAYARDIGLDHQADRIIDIADTEEDPARARVMIDARKWHLSKMAPKRYGDTLTAEVTGADGGPLVIEKIVREVIDAA
jgi:hypothetical protein